MYSCNYRDSNFAQPVLNKTSTRNSYIKLACLNSSIHISIQRYIHFFIFLFLYIFYFTPLYRSSFYYFLNVFTHDNYSTRTLYIKLVHLKFRIHIFSFLFFRDICIWGYIQTCYVRLHVRVYIKIKNVLFYLFVSLTIPMNLFSSGPPHYSLLIRCVYGNL